MDVEARSQHYSSKESRRTVLALAYQSLGVVYGDLSTSPLYVYNSTFAEAIQHSESNDEIFGVLSFVFWTLTLIPLVKYVFIVLRADDNGEGGTFALYSLLCRHARLNTLPNGQLADEDLYEYKKEVIASSNKGLGLKLRLMLEKHKRALLTLALIGTCMVIGDGVLTPAISVFSAVSGLELVVSKHHHQYIEIPIVCIILVLLFYLQHYGTHRIGFLFAPIGAYNIFQWNPHVYHALSPHYMFRFLKKTRRRGWMSLGGILLCITGSETMFADLGHFSQLSIKIVFSLVVYPSLILVYMGQAAYLSKHHMIGSQYQIGFYVSVPERLRWPVLAIAILAAVVGSQAVITGTFSVIKQCCALGCFPRAKIMHTFSETSGRIYSPKINWALMLLCLAVTVSFQNMKHISNASGLAVITVMLVTTWLMSLIIVLCWNRSVLLAICFVLLFGSVEALYFSASLIKFCDGAWIPVALSLIFLMIMFVWHYGALKKYEFDVENKISLSWLLNLVHDLRITRVRGIGLIHTVLVSSIPAILSHFSTNLPAFHQVLVLFCIKYVPVPHVRPQERFLVRRVGPKKYRVYRCIARYGYRDIVLDDVSLEKDLVCSIAEFIRSETPKSNGSLGDDDDYNDNMAMIGTVKWDDYNDDNKILGNPSEGMVKKRVSFVEKERREELEELMEAREAGMAFILGHCHVKAKSDSGLLKKGVIDVGYGFLKRNFRAHTYPYSFPRAATLEVGMVYHV